MSKLRIANAAVYDPASGINGEVQDICIQDGRIVPDCDGPAFDARGMAAFAGGIDPHAHVAGAPLPLARAQNIYPVPTPHDLGRGYLAMGYTLAVNAATSAAFTAQTLLEERAIPSLDTLNLVLAQDPPEAQTAPGDDNYLSSLLLRGAGYGVKSVCPRGGPKVTARLAAACARLKLPHPLHLHHNGLGEADAYRGIGDTLARLEGARLHLAHLQFYAYGEGMHSAAEPVLRLLEQHPHVTADAGLVYFSHALATTADTKVPRRLAAKTPPALQYFGNTAFGVLPLDYKPQNYAGAMQFLIGLELMLKNPNPWQLTLSTDHPNGAPYFVYPRLIALLCDAGYRREFLKTINKKAVANSDVPSLAREYTPYEIAVITRAAPARDLGLRDRGRLGIGAQADVALYPLKNGKPDFSRAAHVFKAGQPVVAEGGSIADAPSFALACALGGGRPSEAYPTARIREVHT